MRTIIKIVKQGCRKRGRGRPFTKREMFAINTLLILIEFGQDAAFGAPAITFLQAWLTLNVSCDYKDFKDYKDYKDYYETNMARDQCSWE